MPIFPPQSKEAWLNKVSKAAKGAAFDADGVLFQRQSGPAAVRAIHAPWQVFARVEHPDVVKAIARAEDDLGSGVDGLIITTAENVAALESLPLHRIALRNEAGDAGADGLRNLIARLPLDPSRLAVDFGTQDVSLVRDLRSMGFVGPFLRGDGRVFHGRGCEDAAELGAALATAISQLRTLEFLNDSDLTGSVSLTLAASQDMFATMAKFRAARILWAEILASCKLPDVPLVLHGETSLVMMADVDAHTNILRAATAVFGAGLGGADSISVLPFSTAQGLPNAFARRVARNVQNLLLHESHLWRVSDPAAGAGAVENLTDQICNEAWSVMQACERGDWPKGKVSKVGPVIGVTVFRPAVDLAPEVEAV